MGSKANSLSDDELQALRTQAYDGYIRIPETRRVPAKGGGWVTRSRDGGGEIDYSAYGGKDIYGSPFMSQAWSRQGRGEDGNNWKNLESWKKVAKELGIKNVNKPREIAEMYDYVFGRGNNSAMEEEPVAEEPAPEPSVFQPSEDLAAAQEDFASGSAAGDSGMEMPRLGTDGNPYTDAINHGNDMNDWYQKRFLPSIRKESMLAAKEVGESGRHHLANWVGKMPELGDMTELTKKYIDMIEG